MAKEIENKIIDTEKQQKRKGFAFMPRAQSMNVKNEIVLKNQLVMRNRQSGKTNETTGQSISDNVFEVYFTKTPKEAKHNYMFIGRDGMGNEGTKNTSYVELNANVDTDQPPSFLNGVVALSLSMDKETPGVLDFQISDGRNNGLPSGSTTAAMFTRNGGLLALGDFSGGVANALLFILGGRLHAVLPTSSAGLSSGALWNDAGTVKIVT